MAGKFQRAAVLGHCTDGLVRRTARKFCLDLQRNFDGRPHQSGEVGNNLVTDPTGIAAYSSRIERDASMEAPGTVFWRSVFRGRLWPSFGAFWFFLRGVCRASNLGLQLLPRHFGSNEQSRKAVRR